jgi:hypothetical protein
MPEVLAEHPDSAPRKRAIYLQSSSLADFISSRTMADGIC